MKFSLTKNTIALRKSLVVAPNDGMDNRIHVATLNANLMKWGWMLSEDAFMALSKSDLSFISNYYKEVVTFLKEATGGKHDFKPLYKGFPKEVMSKSDSELYYNALKHYWSLGNWSPTENYTFEKEIAFEPIKYKMLEEGTESRFSAIFTSLVSINTSLTPEDLSIIKWFVTSGEKLVMPDVIPFKENLCTLASLGLDVPVKTTTDVLRIAVALSGGDISLPKVPEKLVKSNRWSSVKSKNPEREKFKFKRAERRYILSLLEKTNCDVREMKLKVQRWIRLGEVLHPGEYKAKFPKSFEAFNKLRNEKVESWYGMVNKSLSKNFIKGLDVLSQRPGEYARRMDYLVRKNTKEVDEIMSRFPSNKVSNKVLFEIYSHFEKRTEAVKNRTIFIKGARKRTVLPDLPALDSKVITSIKERVIESLKEKFSTLPSLGNVWIDENLKKMPLPSNMRSLNFALKPTIRGARIPFGNKEAKVIRAFCHWMNVYGQTADLDLSATFVGKNVSVLSYSTTGLRVGKSCHSGDITHRPGACAEYIDVEIENALSLGFKYVVLDVRNFSGRSLKSVDSMFGLMEREQPQSGTNWLPETVSNTNGLESSSTNTLIAILDLESKEYIMVDEDMNGLPTAKSNISQTVKFVEDYTKEPSFSVYDLLTLHGETRGKIVNLNSNVDTYFKFDDFINSYEKVGEYMGV